MSDTRPHTFGKAEHLCGRKRIDGLFASGRSLSAYPIRVVYARQDEARVPVSVLVSVPKRHFKHAVDRNRLKRLMREAYRLNKYLLIDQLEDGQHLAIAFLWTSNVKADYPAVEVKIKNLLQRIGEQLHADGQSQSLETSCPSSDQ